MEAIVKLENVKLNREVVGIFCTIEHSSIINPNQDANKVSNVEVPRINVVASVGDGEIVSKKYKAGDVIIIKNNSLDMNNYIIMDELTNERQTVILLIIEHHLIIGILKDNEV